MHRVFLVGDSIRMGYQETARKALADIAEVYAPDENCESSRKIVATLRKWIGDLHPDVIHINCGLHDLKKEFGSDVSAVPLEEYSANVRKIIQQAQKVCDKVIWATITPVNEGWHHANKTFDRFEKDVDSYNRVALAIASECDLRVNDLFALVASTGRDSLLQTDGVHFIDEGYTLLGEEVARVIRGEIEGAESKYEGRSMKYGERKRGVQ